MKNIDVRRPGSAISHQAEALAEDAKWGSDGQTVARTLAVRAPRRWHSLASLRARMTMLPVSMESVVRQERDKR